MNNREKDPKSPATTSAAYDTMAPRWHLIETLLGGTEAMRAAGETYLPRHSEETDKGYEERLSAAVLLLWPADAWPVLLIVAGVAVDAA